MQQSTIKYPEVGGSHKATNTRYVHLRNEFLKFKNPGLLLNDDIEIKI